MKMFFNIWDVRQWWLIYFPLAGYKSYLGQWWAQFNIPIPPQLLGSPNETKQTRRWSLVKQCRGHQWPGRVHLWLTLHPWILRLKQRLGSLCHCHLLQSMQQPSTQRASHLPALWVHTATPGDWRVLQSEVLPEYGLWQGTGRALFFWTVPWVFSWRRGRPGHSLGRLSLSTSISLEWYPKWLKRMSWL